jgi:uncharacterized protein YjcR
MACSYSYSEFKEKYDELKAKHLKEKEIAFEMHIHPNTLRKIKQRYGVPNTTHQTRELVNKNGLTRQWLEIAKINGLNSSLVNARIREHHWSVEDACTIKVGKVPVGRKKNDFNPNKERELV